MLSLAEKGQRWNFTKKQSNWSRETYETCQGVQECKVKEVKECNSKGNDERRWRIGKFGRMLEFVGSKTDRYHTVI